MFCFIFRQYWVEEEGRYHKDDMYVVIPKNLYLTRFLMLYDTWDKKRYGLHDLTLHRRAALPIYWERDYILMMTIENAQGRYWNKRLHDWH